MALRLSEPSVIGKQCRSKSTDINLDRLSQYWMLSKTGEIRRDESCLDYSGADVILYPCHGSKGNQQWIYNPQTKQIRHGSSDKCLAITESKQRLIMEECSSTAARQRWSFENYDPSKL
ncbi:hypothetical protein K0M31_010707 [Melipona bicolor]|uniref:Ricin B lectin domain-containing protein n=1 Tax=Melipona bicolor TaxID=60889 RepID=A0AA40FL46_9HYME|nr:hypothetical protein K0M31_010707 [Melipona bicolor]